MLTINMADFPFACRTLRFSITITKTGYILCVLLTFIVIFLQNTNSFHLCESRHSCFNGYCNEQNQCVCLPGWAGKKCDHCFGRVRLNESEGIIIDGAKNYSLNKKCTWLIEGSLNSTIHLVFNQFVTECAWDHLYIYDGNSVFSELVAIYSGIKRSQSNGVVSTITLHSGSAYLHFYSDAAYNMSGFNITYIVDTCPLNCSGNGLCIASQCSCQPQWYGSNCEIPVCPNNCGGVLQGSCNLQRRKCICSSDYTGFDCSLRTKNGSWSDVNTISPLKGTSSHCSIVYKRGMYVFGGMTFQHHKLLNIYKLNFIDFSWENIGSTGRLWPNSRYDHSIVLRDEKVLMFGGSTNGDVVNELWEFDLLSHHWVKHNTADSDLPLAVVGHTSHSVGDVMLVIFGHSHIYGYMSTVQEYNIVHGNWSVVKTNGAIVKGGYGHTSVYDQESGLIFVYGGYHSNIWHNSYYLSDVLYSYHVASKTWHILRSSGQYKYLHSAVIISGLMLIFGGYTDNDTYTSNGATCYSVDFLAYDIKCHKWLKLNPPHLPKNIARYGHSAVSYENKMYVYGGFDSEMNSDVLEYTPGKCSRYGNKASCLEANPGVVCVWTGQGCLLKEDALQHKAIKTISSFDERTCNTTQDIYLAKHICSAMKNCRSCLFNSMNCYWCIDHCLSTSENCIAKDQTTVDARLCPFQYSNQCIMAHTCQWCHQEEGCIWHKSDKVCISKFRIFSTAVTRKQELSTNHSYECGPVCDSHTDCVACTKAGCMWCSNTERCVRSNSYVASFPYGQCMQWMNEAASCKESKCSIARTCFECHNNPECGWCDDGSNTGLGKCMVGGDYGPYSPNSEGVMKLHISQCPAKSWYFSSCPYCQCNGHSSCYPGTNKCMNCNDLTEGNQCQFCKDGFFGTSTNGGNCTVLYYSWYCGSYLSVYNVPDCWPCDCNNQAEKCDRLSGKCHCHTSGVIGDKCDRCNEEKDYIGDPRNSTCYYLSKTNYQFTFTLAENDVHYSHINFMNTPINPDLDVEFSVHCSKPALMNITVKTKNNVERTLLVGMVCQNYKAKFSHSRFSFSSDVNTTFFVYMYGFTTPFWLRISFTQYKHIDLVQFFIVFFSCFLALLLLAAMLWKIKLRYDTYRRRRRLIVEMERMVSRPFAVAKIEIPPPFEDPYGSRYRSSLTHTDIQWGRKLKNGTSPIILEPLANNNAAVLSVIVRLPTGDCDYSPAGQAGICIASALTTLNARQSSHDKLDKTKRKHSSPTIPDTCL